MNDDEWQKMRNASKQMATEEYATEASNLIRLTKAEISSIVEEASVDKDKLTELITVVNDVAKSNSEKADAIRNMAGFAEVAASLIGKLV